MTRKLNKPSETIDTELNHSSDFQIDSSDTSVSTSLNYGRHLPAAQYVPLSNGKKLQSVPGGGDLKPVDSKKPVCASGKLKRCKYCEFDGVFKYGGEDTLYRKGIWQKGRTKVCVKKHSLQEQNNKGVWYVCDEEQMHKCHYYEPEE